MTAPKFPVRVIIPGAPNLGANLQQTARGKIPDIPGQINALLQKPQNAATAKLAALNRIVQQAANIPDFSIPKLPGVKLRISPNVIPTLPQFTLPNLPKLPNLPQLPQIPQLPSVLEANYPIFAKIPKLPPSPSMPSLPQVKQTFTGFLQSTLGALTPDTRQPEISGEG